MEQDFITENAFIEETNDQVYVDIKDQIASKFFTTGEELINMKQEKLNYLIEGLLPKTGVVPWLAAQIPVKAVF